MLPFCGVAMILPLSWSGEVMSGETTSWAPPDVEPAMIRTAWPLDLANALIAGLEPMNPASSEPPSSAETSSPPALNVCVVSFVEPSSAVKKPWATPMIAGAWVMLGK